MTAESCVKRELNWTSSMAAVSQLGLALSVTGLIAGQFGRWSYLCDLASHFRCQYALSMLVLGVTLAVTRTRLGLLAAALGVGLLAALISYLPQMPANGQTDGLRVVSMNVLFANRQYQDVIQFLRQQDPDIVALIEVTPRWLEALDLAMADYPFRSHDGRHHVGIAIYSRLPILSARTLFPAEAYECTLEVAPRTSLRLIAAHTPAPTTRHRWIARNKLFRMLGAEVAQAAAQPRTLLVGDLNCTPWSPWFTWLLRETGLRDSAVGHGLWPTWYALPTLSAAIPIDHALVGAQIEVLQRQVGPYLGSDHRPLTVDFRLQESERM